MTAHVDPAIAAYRSAQQTLLGLIDPTRHDAPSRSERLRRAEQRLHRTRALLATLGNPHLRYPVVHVTGTSGKGSTCAAIAAILTAAGYRVGLRTSPYLQVSTEKLQIGPSLTDAFSLANESAVVLGAAERLATGAEQARPSYAEAWSGIAFSWFARRGVDIAVVEVGAGGRFDATNVVQPAVSVITSVGLDHVVSLGPTLADIAWHKAGIIKPGSMTVVGELPDEAIPAVREAVRAAQSPVIRARDVSSPLGVSGSMPLQFQQQNARLAIAAVAALRLQGFAIPDAAIRAGLAMARLPGRFEPMPASAGPRVWIDGAHNPDKIDAVLGAAETLARKGASPIVIFGSLQAKDVTAIASRISRIASTIVTTQPLVLGKPSLPADALAQTIRDCGFRGQIVCEPIPLEALAHAETLAADDQADVLVTGSLYLAGEVRRRWYSDAEIVIQRTSWPKAPASDRIASA